MEIRIRYKDGHLDLFDTTTFTKSEPFIGTNMLTEFVVETDGIEESGLWLSVHSYDASQQEADAAAEPVAFRKRGWKFLLAEAGEVDEIESVTVGGTMLLHRVLGELVCIEILNDSAAIWLGNPPWLQHQPAHRGAVRRNKGLDVSRGCRLRRNSTEMRLQLFTHYQAASTDHD